MESAVARRVSAARGVEPLAGIVSAQFQRGLCVGVLCRSLFSRTRGVVVAAGSARADGHRAEFLLGEQGLGGLDAVEAALSIIRLYQLHPDDFAGAAVQGKVLLCRVARRRRARRADFLPGHEHGLLAVQSVRQS